MPLLVTALERDESGRIYGVAGFGGQVLAVTPRQRLADQLALLAGLALVGLGLAVNAFWTDLIVVGYLQVGGGLALTVWSFWDVGRRSCARVIAAGRGLAWTGWSFCWAWLA